jgi:two-component system, LuxR family, response regulator FixJ
MGGPIYVIDDDDWVCDSVTVLLETYGYEVLAYGSGEQFLRADGRGNAECLVIDQHMPGIDGLGVVAELRREGIAPPTILITGRLDATITQRAGQLGILAVLEKPFSTGRLLELIRSALEHL